MKRRWRTERSLRLLTSAEVLYRLPSNPYSSIGCGKDNKLDKDSVIRCIYCGHRIFYKKRERKLLQYEAR